jgi:hypothetical protein
MKMRRKIDDGHGNNSVNTAAAAVNANDPQRVGMGTTINVAMVVVVGDDPEVDRSARRDHDSKGNLFVETCLGVTTFVVLL